jgi:hypothetical protein
LNLYLENFPETNLRSSSEIFSAFFPSILVDFKSSSEIFSAFFHLPCPILGVRRESFQHYSIYPSRLPKFVGNLFRNISFTVTDILRSPKNFSAFFHYHRPISKVRRESFRHLSINTSRPTKIARILCGNFPSYPGRLLKFDANLSCNSPLNPSDFLSSSRVIPANFYPTLTDPRRSSRVFQATLHPPRSTQRRSPLLIA